MEYRQSEYFINKIPGIRYVTERGVHNKKKILFLSSEEFRPKRNKGVVAFFNEIALPGNCRSENISEEKIR